MSLQSEQDEMVALMTEVIELVCQRFGTKPSGPINEAQRVFYCQLGMAAIFKAADNNPAKAGRLFKMLLRAPASVLAAGRLPS